MGGVRGELDLSDFTALEVVHMPWNNLTKLNLSNTPNLVRLNVVGSLLTKLDASDSPRLESLFVGFNLLTELDVSNNPLLRELDMSDNQIRDISSISGLNNLELVWLDGNQITDFSPLVDLAKRTNNLDVIISRNPITQEEYHKIMLVVYPVNMTIDFAVEILCYVVGLPSELDHCSNAFAAALIVSEDEPGVDDALEILKYAVGLESTIGRVM
jgi:Leucine-rich repeat (LRR) protein